MVHSPFIKEKTPCVNHNDFLTYKTYSSINFSTGESCTWDRLNSSSCTTCWDLPGWSAGCLEDLGDHPQWITNRA